MSAGSGLMLACSGVSDDADLTGDGSGQNLLDRVLDRVDVFLRRHAVLAFPMAVLKKLGDDRGSRLAALVAYYGFFSLFPLLLILVTVVGFVLSGNPGLQQDVIDAVIRQFPVLSDEIRENIGSLRGHGLGLAVGVAGLLWAGMGVMASLQDAMNTVWDVPIKWRPNFFEKRGRALLMLALLGLGFLLSAVVAGASVVGSLGSGFGAGGLVLSFLIDFGLFLVAFRTLTDRTLPWRAFAPGAALGAAGWVLLQSLGGLYVQRAVTGAGATYGFFAVVIGLLSWMYLLALWVILTAEVNAVHHNHLWPRTFFGNALHEEADREALKRYALVEQRRAGQVVHVRFPASRAPQMGRQEDGGHIRTRTTDGGRRSTALMSEQPPNRDTPTGTDPEAPYEEPGFEDKSFGQAVRQDEELAEDVLDETGGDRHQAEEEFEARSVGAPARERQERPETS